MKIALFTDSFLPGIGGTENVVLKLAKEYSKEHEVTVFAPSYHKPYEQTRNLPFKVVRAPSIRTSKNDFWAQPYFSRKFKKALIDFKPDVVHFHTLGMMAGYAIRYAKKYNVPSICTGHTKYAYCFKDVAKFDFIVNILTHKIIKRANNADKVCAISKSMVEEMKSYGLKKEATVVKNGCSAVTNDNLDVKKKDEFTLLFVGMINKYKNIGFSLQALSELKKIRSDFKFRLIGRGAHEKVFKKMAKKLGIDENVEFVGPITDKQVLFNEMASSHVLLFTSIADSEGLVVLECASQNVPTLTLEGTGGAGRLEDNHTGFIAKREAKDVAERINKIMNDRELLEKVSKNAHLITTTWQQTVDEYVAIYKEEIAKKQLEK